MEAYISNSGECYYCLTYEEALTLKEGRTLSSPLLMLGGDSWDKVARISVGSSRRESLVRVNHPERDWLDIRVVELQVTPEGLEEFRATRELYWIGSDVDHSLKQID